MNEAFPPPGLPPGTAIDVWRVDLDLPFESSVNIGAVLSTEERGRAERLIYARDANRFRVCRVMLRLGLGWYLGQSPAAIELTAGRRGKPELAKPTALHFNVTHCGGVALIAFTTAGEVGIDVEAVNRGVESLDIANSNFTRREAGMIAAVPSREEQTRIFLRFWTRKEAVLKAAGGGLLHGLDRVDVSGEPPGVVELAGEEGVEKGERGVSRWLVRDIEGITGCAAAVAAQPGDWSVRMWAIRFEDAILRVGARFPGAQ
jgi:4'-phosphopantetheinyl transferase